MCTSIDCVTKRRCLYSNAGSVLGEYRIKKENRRRHPALADWWKLLIGHVGQEETYVTLTVGFYVFTPRAAKPSPRLGMPISRELTRRTRQAEPSKQANNCKK